MKLHGKHDKVPLRSKIAQKLRSRRIDAKTRPDVALLATHASWLMDHSLYSLHADMRLNRQTLLLFFTDTKIPHQPPSLRTHKAAANLNSLGNSSGVTIPGL